VHSDRWAEFIDLARWMRARPTFGLERDYRLRLAEAVGRLIDAAQRGRGLADPARMLAECHLSGLETVLPPRQLSRLVEWAEHDEGGLAAALKTFADPVGDPERQVKRFVEAVEAGPGTDSFLGGGLAVGSLLAFGGSPETQPIMSGRFSHLRQLLDDGGPESDIGDAYRRNLAFARRVEAALRRSGVPVRDMIDVESVVSLCAASGALWTKNGDAAERRRTSDADVYLAACLLYRNEAAHLAEWIEFHRLVGVERFYLYDNESDDHDLEVLAPYVEQGIVGLHQWPEPWSGARQVLCYDECVATHGSEARWIAFIDADEFLFSPTGRPLSEILVDYERWPGVVANWVMFGTSGHVAHPGGLVLENYTTRFDGTRADLTRMGMLGRANDTFKSIVDPAMATRCANLHAWEYARGTAVNENGYPISSRSIFTKSPSTERLRINHYFARSEADLRAKYARRLGYLNRYGPDADPLPPSTELHRSHAGATDDAILSYLPALREALRRRARSS
jgi:hypothetical protein